MGSTHFLTKRLPRASTKMSLHVLAYNFKRVMRIMGAVPLMQAMRAQPSTGIRQAYEWDWKHIRGAANLNSVDEIITSVLSRRTMPQRLHALQT